MLNKSIVNIVKFDHHFVSFEENRRMTVHRLQCNLLFEYLDLKLRKADVPL